MRTSLRLRVVLALVGLLAVGLVGFSAGVNTLLRGYLSMQLDEQLLTAKSALQADLRDGTHGGLSQVLSASATWPELKRALVDGTDPNRPLFPPGLYAEISDNDGTVLDRGLVPAEQNVTPPALPAKARYWHLDRPVGMIEIGSGDSAYRVMVTPLQVGGAPRLLVLGLPMRSVMTIMNQLMLLELIFGTLVVVCGVVAALLLARLATRPLVRIARTADAIAAGDLSLRVSDAGRRSEVGRVGLALNAMLVEIQRAMDRLVESERRMRLFLADASHELSTPLTSIRGYAELFRAGARNRPQDLDRVLARIESEATRMSGLVNDLMLLAELDELDEARPPRLERVDLSMIAAESVDDARVRAPDRLIDLETTGPVWVQAEASRLRQVAANLTSNACRHTPGGTAIHVRVLEEQGAAVLEVADEGPGLTPEQARSVFDRFYAGPKGGAGLGLAIVAAIAAAHGGRVQVDSGPGAVFRLELPIYDRFLSRP